MIEEQFLVRGNPNILLKLLPVMSNIYPFGCCKQDFIFYFELADSVVIGISVYFGEVLEIRYLIQLLIDAQAEDSLFRMVAQLCPGSCTSANGY